MLLNKVPLEQPNGVLNVLWKGRQERRFLHLRCNLQAKCCEVEVRNSGIPGPNVVFHLGTCLVQEVGGEKVKKF